MPITAPSYVAPNELIQSAWGNATVDALLELDAETIKTTAAQFMTGPLTVNAGNILLPSDDLVTGAYSSTVAGAELRADGPLGSTVTNTAGGTDLTPNLGLHRWGTAAGQPSAAAGRYVTMNRQGTTIGTIEINGSGTGVVYQTTSDARLKSDVAVAENDGLETIAALTVHRFYWGDNADTELGLYAQELYEVVPTAVSVGGDDPAEKPWMIGYGSQEIIGHLILAVQQLAARLSTLEAV